MNFAYDIVGKRVKVPNFDIRGEVVSARPGLLRWKLKVLLDSGTLVEFNENLLELEQELEALASCASV